jgi:hypothetical protein
VADSQDINLDLDKVKKKAEIAPNILRLKGMKKGFHENFCQFMCVDRQVLLNAVNVWTDSGIIIKSRAVKRNTHFIDLAYEQLLES